MMRLFPVFQQPSVYVHITLHLKILLLYEIMEDITTASR